MKKKTGIFILLAAVVVFALQFTAGADTLSQNAKKAYAAQLSKSYISFSEITTNSVPTSVMQFSMVDFDNNGIPELVVKVGQAGGVSQYKMYIENNEIWSFENGRLVQHKEPENGTDDLHGLSILKYYPTKGIYYMEGGFKMMAWEKYYRYSNGKCTLLAKAYGNSGYPNESSITEEYYNGSGARITKAGYDNLVNSLIGGAAATNLTYYKNTASNRTNYILNRTLPSENRVPGTPALVSAVNRQNGIEVKWNKAANAEGYVVYRSTNGDSWKYLRTMKGYSSTSCIDTTAAAGTQYRYTVRSYRGDQKSGYDKNGKAVIRLTNPGLTKAYNGRNGIQVLWNKVQGATGYLVYRKTSGTDWKRIGIVESGSTPSFLDTGVKNAYGQTIVYTVRAKNGNCLSDYYRGGLTFFRLGAPALNSVTNVTGGRATVVWQKLAAASGYQIQYSQSNQFTTSGSVTRTSPNVVKHTVENLTKGKTWYFRIRPYRDINGKRIYGYYSNVISVKIVK